MSAIVNLSKEWDNFFKCFLEKMGNFIITLFSFEKCILEHYGLRRFSARFFHKSISPFQKWTKKMSKNENPKYFCAKSYAFPPFPKFAR
jgi:hypothetical protein